MDLLIAIFLVALCGVGVVSSLKSKREWAEFRKRKERWANTPVMVDCPWWHSSGEYGTKVSIHELRASLKPAFLQTLNTDQAERVRESSELSIREPAPGEIKYEFEPLDDVVLAFNLALGTDIDYVDGVAGEWEEKIPYDILSAQVASHKLRCQMVTCYLTQDAEEQRKRDEYLAKEDE